MRETGGEQHSVFVLIWSAGANASKHILNEINQAFDQGIIIIPFRIQDVQPTRAMRYYLGNTHWLDAIDPPLEKHIIILINTILVNLGREPLPSPTSPLLEDSPEEEVKPLEEPSLEKVPDIEKSEAVKTPVLPPRQKKSQKKPKRIQPSGAAPVNLKRFVPFAAVGLVVLTLIVLMVSGVFKGSSPAEITQSPLSQTDTVSPSVTITPTSTSRPIETDTPIPDWVKEISEPILAAIKDSPPDFTDDFSQVDPGWSYFPHKPGTDTICDNPDGAFMSIADGSMKCSVDPNCRGGILSHPNLQFANFAMQVDINLQDNTLNDNPLNLEFRFWPLESLVVGEQMAFWLNGSEGIWIFEELVSGDLTMRIEGEKEFDFSKPVTVTIIYASPNFLVYLNSSLATSYTMVDYSGPNLLDFGISSNSGLTEIKTFEMDNLKIWDLDKIETTGMSLTSELGIGSTKISPLGGMVQVYIPEGEFEMGSDNGVPDESPVHTVYLDAFWMDEHEVTSGQFQEFLEEVESDAVPCGDGDDHPVRCVDWNSAQAYCEWRGARLPTEAEWEKAARGGLEGKKYPWGDESPVCQEGADNGAQYIGCSKGTVPVKTFAPNGYGLYDMAGNAFEWAADWYNEDYYKNSPTNNPQSQNPSSVEIRVMRGGSYYDYGELARAANRERVDTSSSYTLLNIGFRCAASVP